MVGPPQCRPPMNHAKPDSGILKTIEAKTICQSSAISLIPLAIWAYLLFGRGWFWLCGERDDSAAVANMTPNAPDAWRSVVAIIPARDEADMIARSVSSLLRQDYPGPFSVLVVDDQSADGTSAVASNAASDAHAADRLKIVTGNGPPPG